MKETSRCIIWDLPTRVFHWLTVCAFAAALITQGDDRYLFFHVFSGYVFIGLLVFRLLWGVVGSHYARFHTFAHDWKSVIDYLWSMLNGQAMRYIGHNPAGGWAIFLMLALGLFVSITGMLTMGGEENHGLLAGVVDFRVGIISHDIHEYAAWFMLAVVGVHLLGVMVESLVHRENLIWTMITGKKEADAGVVSVHGHHLLGLLIVSVISISAVFYFQGYLVESADHLYLPYKGPDLPDNELWRSECGDCHFAFHPTLLPKRSWQKIFAEQHEHFGDDLDLDDDTLNELLEFHLKYSAESGLTEPARKILFYTPENETPIRVSETHYVEDKHAEIDPSYWKHEKVLSKSNCAACHLDAKEGTYEDSDMRLPE